MSLPIFASCRDCLSYLASAETVCDLLLPAETSCCAWKIPSCRDCPCDLASCTDRDSLCREAFFMEGSLGRKQEIKDSLGGSQI